VAKIGFVVEEADESVYWLDMIAAAEIHPGPQLKSLQAEANELSRIFNQSQLTAKTNAVARHRTDSHASSRR